jgi:hypothetical protein
MEEGKVVRIPEGRCALCSEIFSKRAMTRHLQSCREEHPRKLPGRGKPRQEKVFHVVVEGAGLPQYWMHLEAPAGATLSDLDALLRETWLECCGHMSAFTIGNERYSISPLTEYGEREMGVALGDVLRRGLRFYHEYDFGTTTALLLKVVSETERVVNNRAIEILALNLAPVIPCDVCGKPAEKVCAQCIWEKEAWLCRECAAQHECGEEMLLPVVNSPRTGMCAYGTD